MKPIHVAAVHPQFACIACNPQFRARLDVDDMYGQPDDFLRTVAPGSVLDDLVSLLREYSSNDLMVFTRSSLGKRSEQEPIS